MSYNSDLYGSIPIFNLLTPENPNYENLYIDYMNWIAQQYDSKKLKIFVEKYIGYDFINIPEYNFSVIGKQAYLLLNGATLSKENLSYFDNKVSKLKIYNETIIQETFESKRLLEINSFKGILDGFIYKDISREIFGVLVNKFNLSNIEIKNIKKEYTDLKKQFDAEGIDNNIGNIISLLSNKPVKEYNRKTISGKHVILYNKKNNRVCYLESDNIIYIQNNKLFGFNPINSFSKKITDYNKFLYKISNITPDKIFGFIETYIRTKKGKPFSVIKEDIVIIRSW